MTKFLMVCAVAFTTFLGGCASTGGGPPTQTDITTLIAQVQMYTKAACGFVPTAATILTLISGGNPGVIAGTSIAQAICGAIVTPMASNKRMVAGPRVIRGWTVTPGMVNGVVIR